MICLDTNYLIGGLCAESPEAKAMITWAMAGETFITPMTAWYEFLCGPVNAEQVATMRAFIHEIVIFGEPQADEAARLFNATGRKRHLRVDSMIAGTALVARTPLATNNRADFSCFIPFGLQLV